MFWIPCMCKWLTSIYNYLKLWRFILATLKIYVHITVLIYNNGHKSFSSMWSCFLPSLHALCHGTGLFFVSFSSLWDMSKHLFVQKTFSCMWKASHHGAWSLLYHSQPSCHLNKSMLAYLMKRVLGDSHTTITYIDTSKPLGMGWGPS